MNIGEVLSKEPSDSVTTAVVLVSGPSEMVLEFGIYSPIMYAWRVLQVVLHFIDEQSSRHQFHQMADEVRCVVSELSR